jgi:hypothetical protein
MGYRFFILMDRPDLSTELPRFFKDNLGTSIVSLHRP